MVNLTRWDPFGDVTRFGLFDQPFDNLVRRFFRSIPVRDETAMTISVDVNESDKAYTVKAEIPGVSKDDISVAIDGNQVSISAEVKKEKEEKEGEKCCIANVTMEAYIAASRFQWTWIRVNPKRSMPMACWS